MLIFGAVQVPVMLGLALLLALLLDSPLVKGKKFFRLAFFAPYAVPGVIAAIMWGFLYSPNLSPFTALTENVDFLGADLVLWSIANVVTWVYVGYNMLIIYSALLAIPTEIYEAARLDGASQARIAWSIKIPLVAPAITLTAIFSIIGTLQLLAEPQVFKSFTSAVSSTFTPNLTIYSTAAVPNVLPRAAFSVVLAIFTFALSFLVLRVHPKERRRMTTLATDPRTPRPQPARESVLSRSAAMLVMLVCTLLLPGADLVAVRRRVQRPRAVHLDPSALVRRLQPVREHRQAGRLRQRRVLPVDAQQHHLRRCGRRDRDRARDDGRLRDREVRASVASEAAFNVILGGVLVPGDGPRAAAVPAVQPGRCDEHVLVGVPAERSSAPFGVYLARIYASASVPDEIIEAARIDGAGEVRTFFTVATRLMAPAMVTIFLFQFVSIWNNFFLPLIMLRDQDLFPVTLGLYVWNTQVSQIPEIRVVRDRRRAAVDRAADHRVPRPPALLAQRPRIGRPQVGAHPDFGRAHPDRNPQHHQPKSTKGSTHVHTHRTARGCTVRSDRLSR